MIKLSTPRPKKNETFGPWDLYTMEDGEWVLSTTYYYKEDIPEGLERNKMVAIVKMGEEPPQI